MKIKDWKQLHEEILVREIVSDVPLITKTKSKESSKVVIIQSRINQ